MVLRKILSLVVLCLIVAPLPMQGKDTLTVTEVESENLRAQSDQSRIDEAPELITETVEFSPALPAPTLYKTISDAVQKLAAAELLDLESPECINHVMKALAQAVSTDITYIPPPEVHGGGEEPQETDDSKYQDLETRTFNQGIGYCRIPACTNTHIKKIRNFIKKAANENYEGVIFDLRYASGDAFEAVGELAVLINKTEFPAIIMLVNNATTGAAELFAQLVADRPRTMFIGQPTHGQPFATRKIMLSNGGAFEIPDRETPAATPLWPPQPLPPDVQIKNIIARKNLADMNDMKDARRLDRDHTLRRAVDLLTAIQGLARRNF